jgi:hypothetical protein
MNLIVKGNTEILGKEIPIIEGGFGEGKKALTDKMIAEIHEIEAKEVRKAVNRNIARFKEGIDYINLKGGNEITSLENYGYSKQAITQADKLFLLSERGYAKLIKIMDSDKAWEIHDILLDEYFSMREVVKASTNNQNDLFASIFAPAMEAMTRAISENMNNFQIQMRKEVLDTRNIITEQEIKHIEQLKSTRELIGFKTENTLGVATLLKTKISDLKGYTVRAKDDYHYQLAKQRLFDKYGVFKWEDMPIDRFDEIHADIDSIEDLDDLFIK